MPTSFDGISDGSCAVLPRKSAKEGDQCFRSHAAWGAISYLEKGREGRRSMDRPFPRSPLFYLYYMRFLRNAAIGFSPIAAFVGCQE